MGPESRSGKAKPAQVDDFVLLTDQFVGGGDLIASSRISAMLARMQHPYRLRIGSDVSFQDLRAAPAILVGYSYTRWKEISNQLRFFIDTSREPVGITDNGKLTELTLPNLPADRRTSEDYAIVSRVFHPDTHAMLVELAGHHAIRNRSGGGSGDEFGSDGGGAAWRSCRLAEPESAVGAACEGDFRDREFAESGEDSFLVSASFAGHSVAPAAPLRMRLDPAPCR